MGRGEERGPRSSSEMRGTKEWLQQGHDSKNVADFHDEQLRWYLNRCYGVIAISKLDILLYV